MTFWQQKTSLRRTTAFRPAALHTLTVYPQALVGIDEWPILGCQVCPLVKAAGDLDLASQHLVVVKLKTVRPLAKLLHSLE